MSESAVLRSIMLACCRGAVRLFRQNTGQAWVGEIVRRTPETLTLRNYRPLHAGLCKGSADLIGWRSVVVTPEMVGSTVAVFASVEVKDKGRPTPEQKAWAECVQNAGGLAGVARSPEEATAILNTLPAPTAQKG